MGIRGVQKHITRLEEWLNARDAATVAQPMSFGEFSKVLDVGYHTIGNWVKDGSIKTNPSGQIVPVDVLGMLRNPPAPVAEAETPTTPVPGIALTSSNSRARECAWQQKRQLVT